MRLFRIANITVESPVIIILKKLFIDPRYLKNINHIIHEHRIITGEIAGRHGPYRARSRSYKHDGVLYLLLPDKVIKILSLINDLSLAVGNKW